MITAATVPQFLAVIIAASAILPSITCSESPIQTESFSALIRKFAVDFLRIISVDGVNAVFSPVSISTMLSLIQQGAEGNTAKEFEKVLGQDATSAKVAYETLIKSLLTEYPGVSLTYGSRVYTKPGIVIRPEFKDAAVKSFGSSLEELNFAEKTPEEITNDINTWVSNSTGGRITDLIEPHMVSPEVIMLLVNALYFKGTWKERFREQNTRVDNFELSPVETVSANFMNQKKRFYSGLNRTIGVKWVELPYEGSTHSMFFILPLKRHTLGDVIERLTGEHLAHMFSSGFVTEVRLRVPKFKLRGKYSLPDVLRILGLRDVFGAASNLVGITPEPLHISEAYHQSNVEIDEKGAVASAATIFSMSRNLVSSDRFRLDQPFLFFIVDTANNVPIFAGKVSNPNG